MGTGSGLEIAVDELEAARVAAASGADRIELCAALELDGITPGPDLVGSVLDAVEIPVAVLVRPRPGGFVYRGEEADLYVAECRRLAAFPVESLVVGALTGEGTIDFELLDRLREAAGGRSLVFHRAFDLLEDPDEDRLRLAAWGMHRILTSGGAATATAGRERLRRWAQDPAGPRIVAAGGIRRGNAAALLEGGLKLDLHSSGRTSQGTATARFRGPFLGPPPSRGIDPEEVAALAALTGASK
jgi:copper homeostasis protein